MPDLFLSLGFVKGLFDQLRVELRFTYRGFSLLHFPKTGLKRACRGKRLPQFMAPDNVHEAKVWEGIS